tara:strand:+ start:261 stop:446 length:186 start_codon:yes stop_codon:yes gene_type:complete
MNKVDSQLSQINKILTSYDSTLNVEDLLLNVYENIENNIVKQLKDKTFKDNQKIKDDNLVS